MKVECKHCGHFWEYGGKLDRATCPNCGRKTPTSTKGNKENIMEKLDKDVSSGNGEDDD